MQHYAVQSANPKGPLKQLTLSDGKKSQLSVSVPRFASVGKGDEIVIDPNHPQNVFCVSAEDPNDLIRIAPRYEAEKLIRLGSLEIPGRLVEIAKPEDLSAWTYLEQFHYKSLAATDEDAEQDLFAAARAKSSSLGGRKAVVLLYLKLFGSWEPAGYIEVQMPLMMCKPRHELFEAPFHHSRRPISWSSWDQHAMKKYVNTIARIARVVVNPEYRGLGLARILITAVKDYCRERWHISGRRPAFMEISAEMLNYVDFVSSSGFLYIGKTEGNSERIVKDMTHMQKGYAISSGIMSLQKKYLTSIQSYSKETKIEFEDVLTRLKEIVAQEDPTASLTPEEWAAFRKVLRPRIPYYLCPLDEDTSAYLNPLVRTRRKHSAARSFSVRAAKIEIAGIQVRSIVPLPSTKNVRMIMNAFGINGATIENIVVPPTPMRASAGNIILLVGASGSGKSALLHALDPTQRSDKGYFEVNVNGSRDYTCGWLRSLPEDIALFDYFANRYSAERAFAALSQVGLSEAFVLVKPFSILSRGQQYRAMLADLILREEQVWLLDEFCADLDPISARVVAHNFRRNVMAGGRIAVVAAANHAHFLDALRPSQIVQLRTGGEAKFVSFKEYRDELRNHAI